MKCYGVCGGLLVLLLLLSGCPYESVVPIGSPGQYPVDSKLIGNWSSIGKQPADSSSILIARFNASEYYVEVHEAGDEEIARLRAFGFEIAGRQFLHVNALNSDGTQEPFFVVRFELLEGDQLSLRFVGDAIVPESLNTDAKALADFLAAHLDDPKLYDDEDLLRRIAPE
jgi:hypothetical protein